MTNKEIIASLSPYMRKAYRKLRINARSMGQVLIYSGDELEFQLEIVDDLALNSPEFMRNRVILYDGRKKKTFAQKISFMADQILGSKK